MKYGRYPIEPYGWHGGWQNKDTVRNSYGFGYIAGWLIAAVVIIIFKLTIFLVKSFIAGIPHMIKSFVIGFRHQPNEKIQSRVQPNNSVNKYG